MAENLLSLFPKPEDLLALEPEELGGAVLEAAPAAMNNGLFDIFGLLAPLVIPVGNGYPPELISPVRNAIAEALSWLTTAGLIIPDPDQTAWFRLTRLGERLKTRADFAAFRGGIAPNPQQTIPNPRSGARRTDTPPPLPVQTYLVTTPLRGFDATLVSLTLRFDEAFHNFLPELLPAILMEEFEGWERVPIQSAWELLDLLAVDEVLRSEIIAALNSRAAALRFSDPTPLRWLDLQHLSGGIAAFAKLGLRTAMVGVALFGVSIVVIQVAYGVGTVGQYAVTQWGEAAVDRVTALIRESGTPRP